MRQAGHHRFVVAEISRKLNYLNTGVAVEQRDGLLERCVRRAVIHEDDLDVRRDFVRRRALSCRTPARKALTCT